MRGEIGRAVRHQQHEHGKIKPMKNGARIQRLAKMADSMVRSKERDGFFMGFGREDE